MNPAPAIDMTVTGYEASGSGPDGSAFFTRFVDASMTQQGLVPGDWTITVEGRNAAHTTVTRGTAELIVTTGPSQQVDIILSPVVGTGALTLSATWDPTSVGEPSVSSRLVPSQGTPIDLGFTRLSPEQAVCSDNTLPDGYYTLVIRLLDNGQPVGGAVDVVRIVAGETTTGKIDFTNVTSGDGTIIVSITPQRNEPVQVTMSGYATGLGTGHPITVSASIPPALGEATFAWYVNGVSAGTGSSITLNDAANPLNLGTYRLDVCAFVTNGSRGGSTTCTFKVVQAATEVTLEWDPNSETDLAGYRMYVGTVSGAYGAPIEVGLATTCTVTNLQAGETYYFAVTARNTAGRESAKSGEVSYTAP